MKKLVLYDDYNRQEIHKIFSPNTKFTKNSGTWGLHGIIQIGKTKDYVIIVTQGTVIGSHEFDEGFTEDGVLRWQSQPKNSLKTNKIIDLINHDETTNNIYFFYRETKKNNKEYTYLGLLKYLNHDSDSGVGNEPVNFNFQMMNWPIPKDISSNLNLNFETGIKNNIEKIVKKNFLEIKNPSIKKRIRSDKGLKKSIFKETKIYNKPENDKKLKEIGNKGELLVLNLEIQKLKDLNKNDLAKKVTHIANFNDSAGFDILSYDAKGKEIYIEVKTTLGPVTNDFYMSSGELKFSKDNSEQYYLYRVYEYDEKNNSGNLFIRKGEIDKNFSLKPLKYKVSL